MKNILCIVGALLFSMSSYAAKADHSQFNSLLKEHVSSSGKVSYSGFKSDKAKLQKYLDELETNTVASDWSSSEIKAYWINAYNAYTIKLMVDNYPLKSIKNLKFDGKSAWDRKWIKIGGATLSLNDIEHKKLRAKYKEPRIHFAVNCASFSCPILLNEAYTASKLESQLTKQAKKFINSSARNKITADKVEISKLFDWYKADFTSKGSIIDYLNKYSTVKINDSATITYLTYNWKINE